MKDDFIIKIKHLVILLLSFRGVREQKRFELRILKYKKIALLWILRDSQGYMIRILTKSFYKQICDDE